MKVLIDIPNYEFDNDVKDKFQDYFNRVKQDIADGTMCGNYELEITDMFLASFKRLQVLSDNSINGDMMETVFSNLKGREKAFEIEINVNKNKVGNISTDWWNAPYKEDK